MLSSKPGFLSKGVLNVMSATVFDLTGRKTFKVHLVSHGSLNSSVPDTLDLKSPDRGNRKKLSLRQKVDRRMMTFLLEADRDKNSTKSVS